MRIRKKRIPEKEECQRGKTGNFQTCIVFEIRQNGA
jgi:hypothetical protein